MKASDAVKLSTWLDGKNGFDGTREELRAGAESELGIKVAPSALHDLLKARGMVQARVTKALVLELTSAAELALTVMPVSPQKDRLLKISSEVRTLL